MNIYEFNQAIDQDISHLLIKDINGLYTTNYPLTERDIIKAAKLLIASKFPDNKPSLDSVASCRDFFITHLALHESEVFSVSFLDNKNQAIATEDMFRGSIAEAAVYPREILKKVLQYNAAAIIIAHNHPSGDSTPSEADIRLTRSLRDTLELVQVRLIDHFVVGGNKAESLCELGLI